MPCGNGFARACPRVRTGTFHWSRERGPYAAGGARESRRHVVGRRLPRRAAAWSPGMIRCGWSSRCLALLFLASGYARPLPGQAGDPSQSCGASAAGALHPRRFEAEIRAFEAADRASPPLPGGVVFIGSSSIRGWDSLAADFPGVPVLNRGFGGSTLADVVYYVDRILLPYRPHLVVLYAGDNDLALGRTPGQVVSDYRVFVARL